MQAKDIIFSNEEVDDCLKIFIEVPGKKYSISYSLSYIFSENYTIDNAKNLIPNILNISKKQKYSVINYVVVSLNQYKSKLSKTFSERLIKPQETQNDIPLIKCKPISLGVNPPSKKQSIKPKPILTDIKKPSKKQLIKTKPTPSNIEKRIVVLEKDENSWL